MSIMISMYTSSIPCSRNDANVAFCVQCVLVIHECNAEWYVVFTALLFELVYGMNVICHRVLAPTFCQFSRLIFDLISSLLVVMICVNNFVDS